MRWLPTALGGEEAVGLVRNARIEAKGDTTWVLTALGMLPSALAGDNRSNAGGLPGEALTPPLLLMLEADLLPVTTTLGKLVRGLGQGEGKRCRKADRWRLAAGVGGVALPGVWAEAARPGVTLACTHTDHYLSVTTAEEHLTAWWHLISKVDHNQHQKLGMEKSALVSCMQRLVSQYKIYTIIGVDTESSSKHQGTLVNAMFGKDTAAGEESDLWSEPVGQVGQSRTW